MLTFGDTNSCKCLYFSSRKAGTKARTGLQAAYWRATLREQEGGAGKKICQESQGGPCGGRQGSSGAPYVVRLSLPFSTGSCSPQAEGCSPGACLAPVHVGSVGSWRCGPKHPEQEPGRQRRMLGVRQCLWGALSPTTVHLCGH